MSDKDELDHLRGGVAALKDMLVVAVRAASPDPTGSPPSGRNVVGVFSRNLNSKINSGISTQISDGVTSETEFRSGYTEMIVEMQDALRR